MSKSAGPLLAVGAITMINQSVLNNKSIDWRVPIATGFSVAVFSFLEKGAPKAVSLLAWTALATVMLTRVDPTIPSPTESFLKYWNGTVTNPGR